MNRFNAEGTKIQVKLNGEEILMDELPTIYIYGLYMADDVDKKIYTPTQITSTTNSSTPQNMYYQQYNEIQINEDVKTKLISPKVVVNLNSSQSFTEENVSVQAQGDVTLSKPKKSLKFKFNKAHKISGLEKSKQYTLKCDYFDSSHTLVNGIGNLWRQMMTNRSDYESLPQEIKDSDAKGALRGRPVKMYYIYEDEEGNEICEYFGMYTLVDKKGDKLACFDSSKNPYAFVISNVTCDNTARNDIGTSGTFFNYKSPFKFSKIWNGESTIIENGFEFEDGDNDYRAEKVQKVNEFISLVMNEPEDTFKAKFAAIADVTAFSDYIILNTFGCNSDALKNLMMYNLDYRTGKFFPITYDNNMMTFNSSNAWAYIDATTKQPTTNGEPHILANQYLNESRLWSRFISSFATEIKERYLELRENILTSTNIIKLFYDEYKVTSKYFNKDLYYINDDGEIVNVPEHSTNKFVDKTNFLFDCSIDFINALNVKLDARFVQVDYLFEHFEEYYPFAIIDDIKRKQEEVVVGNGTTSINIFDYFDFSPIGNYISNKYVYDKIVIEKIMDDNSIIDTISSDGTITFTANEGETKICIYPNQFWENLTLTMNRYAQTIGKNISECITIKKYTTNANDVDIHIVNGEPYQFGKEVIVEAKPNGLYESTTWSVSPSTTKYRSNGNKLFITTQPYEENISITYSCTTTEGTFNKDYSITTTIPSSVVDKGSYSYSANALNGLVYENTIIEGEVSIDFITNIDGMAQAYYLFDNRSGDISIDKLTTNEHDELGIWFTGRRFAGKQKVLYQFLFDKNFSQLCTDQAKSATNGGRKFEFAHPFMFDVGERIYFKMCEEYLQVNDKVYPWIFKGTKRKNNKLINPLRLFGYHQNGTTARGNDKIKNSIYWLKVYTNGTLTSHIVPNDISTFETSKVAFKDLVNPSATFTSSGTGTINYTLYPSPLKDDIGIVRYLENNDEGVPFNGSTYIDTGIVAKDNYSYSIKFKPMFTSVNKSQSDSRGRLFGSMQKVHTIKSNSKYGHIVLLNKSGEGGICAYTGNASTETRIDSNVINDSNVVYKVVYTPTSFIVYDENDNILAEKTLTRNSLSSNTNIYLGAIDTFNENVASYSYYISGFYGYIYDFKIYDENGDILSLTPNAKKTGFIDSVSNKEFLIYGIENANEKLPIIEIDLNEGAKIEGTTQQINLTSNSVNNVVSSGKYILPPPNYSSGKFDFPINNIFKESKFLWKIDDDHTSYAKIDDNGLMTIFESANNTKVRVRCYWSIDGSVYDEKEVTITYSK